jgi:hypothetical protein
MTRIRIAVLTLSLLIALAASARIGGGDSYSGESSSPSSSDSDSDSSSYDSGSSYSDYDSSSSSGSQSSGGGAAASSMFVMLFFMMFIVAGVLGNSGSTRSGGNLIQVAPSANRSRRADLSALRNYDPNFSEIVFTDFCYSLYARLHEARGRGQLHDFAPYVSANARQTMQEQNPAGLRSVDQIVIGSFAVASVEGLDTPKLTVVVELEANYTETSASGEQRSYVREQWTLERLRDIVSPAPENARAEHCPKCAAPLQTRTDGKCLHCGTLVDDGTFHWYIRSISVVKKEQRAPVLSGGDSGPERGLDRATVIQPWFGRKSQQFVQEHPGFTWEAFEQRVREVASELQSAWSARDWERARRNEMDALFQMHRYWIDEYKRQGLRNIVDDYTIDKVETAKVVSDAFYDAITVRLYASGKDYTIDDAGTVRGGSRTDRKSWSEYWTFIRGRVAGASDARRCPNCGAARGEGQAVLCDYCGGKITTGEFPWILSRIEQDEAYRD